MSACKHCEHECHCSHGGSCRTVECECINCEHNPLDEFWKQLGKEDAAKYKSKKSYGKSK